MLAVLCNFAFWRLLIALQNRDVRSGFIPARGRWSELRTGRIPHLQDYWTNGVWGDAVALSLVDWVVFSALSREGLNWWMVLFLPVGAVCAVAYFKMATRDERARKGMDWWFVSYIRDFRIVGLGITTAGRLHIMYFALQSGAGFVGLTLLLSARMEATEAAIGIAGGILYGAAFFADKLQGHFE
ncbi:MAG: hypothetical protein Q8Q38_02550 [bacterium]|nr:hypothetical protein [bacterium]MDZ4231970.1 hypothetical protein [Candidatus Pacearchaeota archaeon]